MDKQIDIDGLSAHFTVEGDGPDMIVMHGWGCDSSTVASITHTASSTHKVYTVDFPGFGQSEEPPTAWGVYDYVKWLEHFIEQNSIHHPTLLGHSFGGRVGIVYSSLHPVDRLILVDAAGVKPRRSLKYYYKVYTFKASRKLLELMLGKEKAKQRIDSMRARRGSSDYNSSTPMMRAILSKVVNEDLRRHMPAIQCPTLLIWGENDTATPLGDAKIMERLIPDAGLVSFPGCGHYSFLDNPVQFAAVLRSFLKS